MLSALGLAAGQLADRRIVAVLLKSIAITLVVFAVLGTLGGMAVYALLERTGIDGAAAAGGLPGAGTSLRGIIAGIAVVIGTWLLFRLVAIAVLQFFADEVVEAVELRHYPALAARARPLGWGAELRNGLRGFVRSAAWNLAALPVALLLVVTGIGPAAVFGVVNAVLLGRELVDMVRQRHRGDDGALPPGPPFAARFLLGLAVAGLLAVPVFNLLAPVIGAAAATHLVHRRATGVRHAA